MWIVNATAPQNGWYFPDGYFPKKFRYKKDALERSEEARRNGGINITVEKERKDTVKGDK